MRLRFCEEAGFLQCVMENGVKAVNIRCDVVFHNSILLVLCRLVQFITDESNSCVNDDQHTKIVVNLYGREAVFCILFLFSALLLFVERAEIDKQFFQFARVIASLEQILQQFFLPCLPKREAIQ